MFVVFVLVPELAELVFSKCIDLWPVMHSQVL